MYARLQRHHYQALCSAHVQQKIAEVIGASKSGVNDFLKAFEQCESLTYPLPPGITNYGIAELVYGKTPDGKDRRDLRYELPDFLSSF